VLYLGDLVLIRMYWTRVTLVRMSSFGTSYTYMYDQYVSAIIIRTIPFIKIP